MGALRIGGRLAAMLGALLIALILHGTWRAVGARSPWPPRFLGWIARIVGAQPMLAGAPVARRVLYLSNHVSWLDILVLAGTTGSVFVAKGDLARVPLVGWLCRLHGTIFVDRADRLGVTEQVARLRASLAGEHPVTIFPEGTTEGGGARLLPFKAALLAAADPPPPGLVVQPVAIDYGTATSDVAWVGAETGLANARRILARRGRFAVRLTMLPPFDPAGLGRKGVAARAHDAVAAALADGAALR